MFIGIRLGSEQSYILIGGCIMDCNWVVVLQVVLEQAPQRGPSCTVPGTTHVRTQLTSKIVSARSMAGQCLSQRPMMLAESMMMYVHTFPFLEITAKFWKIGSLVHWNLNLYIDLAVRLCKAIDLSINCDSRILFFYLY